MTPGVRLRPPPEFIATGLVEFSPMNPLDGDDTLAWVTVPDDDDGSLRTGEGVTPVIPCPELVPFPDFTPAELVVGLRRLASRGDRSAVDTGLLVAAGVSWGKD